MASPRIKNSHWIRQSFLVESKQLETVDKQNRFFSTVSLKFTDTTPGGSIAINPPPQFTRYADLRPVNGGTANPRTKAGILANGSMGMGRYYSEAIDDNSQIISMRFGVPEYNSMTTFFTGFYNSGAGKLARTGRAPGIFYTLGRAAGFVVSVCTWKLLAVHMLGVGYKFVTEKPTTKYYYLKPTMALYWNAVQTIVNQIAVNRGMVPRVGDPDVVRKIGGDYQFDKEARAKMHSILPEIFTEGGSINVYAVANRAQRLARAYEKLLEQRLNGDNFDVGKAIVEVQKEIQQNKLSPTGKGVWSNSTTNDTGEITKCGDGYLEKWFNSSLGEEGAAATGKTNGESAITLSTDDTENKITINSKKQAWYSRLKDFADAELDDGSMFATFRVNATGSINESFSNSVTDSDIQSKINGMSSSARETNFSFANGNLASGVIGDMIGGVFNTFKDFASGVADSLKISGLASLGGAAFVDIPKHWQDSSASLPRMNYTINLVTPYGNPMSQLMNIYIPLAMLLAGALPLSTGRHSYTSPFICELFDKGRCQTRLGMIDSLSITRGTGNTGFTRDGHALGVEVSFSVVDLSSIMHMPISMGFTTSDIISITGGAALGAAGGMSIAGAIGGLLGAGFGAAIGAGAFDDGTVFSDYLAVLAGMGLADQIYPLNKIQMNLTRKAAQFDTWASIPHFASWAGDTIPGRVMSAFYKGVKR